MRVSSTQFGVFESCPARWRFGYVEEGAEKQLPSRAMALGTVFHAIAERRLAFGRRPSLREVMRMEGNYEPPSAVLKLYGDELFDDAMKLHQGIDLSALFDGRGAPVIEFDLESLEALHDVEGFTCGGYIDILWPDADVPTLTDWKTRSSFAYAPKNKEEFVHQRQLPYYAAAWARGTGFEGDVRIEHVNVHTGTGDVVVYDATLSRKELDDFWADVVLVYLTTMRGVVEADLIDVTRDDAACWKWGRLCPHADICHKTAEPTTLLDGTDPIADFMRSL